MMYIGRDWQGNKCKYTVAEAVTLSLSDGSHTTGELEQLRSRLTESERAIGHIVQYLADHAPANSAPLREMLDVIVSYRFELEH